MHHPTHKTQNAGFTLLEIMIVVAIIGLLGALALPSFMRARRDAQITGVANNLRVFGDGFNQYAMDTGRFPPDTHITLPAGMEDYINVGDWNTPVLGGNYNWEGPTWGEGGTYPYAGISLQDATADAQTMVNLDAIIDDGDIVIGSFRRVVANSRYTYIIEE